MVVKTFGKHDPLGTWEVTLETDWNNLCDMLDVVIDWTTQKIRSTAIPWTTVNSSINPVADIYYGLGSPTKRWLEIVTKNIYTDGINFPSNATPDTNLYRDSAGMLRTDSNMTIVGNLLVLGTINSVGGEGELPTVLANLEVTNQLTFDNLALFADSGNSIVDGAPVNIATPSGNYLYLFASVISPTDHATPLSDPMLMTNQAFFVEKDFQTYGFVGTSSDPFKGHGGGAILMGQGFTGNYCPPMISLTGTMTGMGQSIGSYPVGTSFPSSPANMDFFYRSDLKTLYQYQIDTWVIMYTDVQSGDYDTLFFQRADTGVGANLWCGNLNSNKIVLRAPNSATVILTQGITNGIRYLMPDGSNETWGIGSQNHYLAFVNSADIFTNRLMPLDNAYITLNAPLDFIDTNVIIYRPTTGSDANKKSLRVQTPNNGGLIVEQGLAANSLSVTTNAGIGGTLSVGSGDALITFYAGYSSPVAYFYTMQNNVGLGTNNYPFKWGDFYDLFAQYSLNLGTGTSAISLTTGVTNGIKYVIFGGDNKTIGLGSANHYLSFVDTDYVFTNDISPLDNSWIDINAKLVVNGNFQITNGHVTSSLNPYIATGYIGAYSLGSPSEQWAGVVTDKVYANSLYAIPAPEGTGIISVENDMVHKTALHVRYATPTVDLEIVNGNLVGTMGHDGSNCYINAYIGNLSLGATHQSGMGSIILAAQVSANSTVGNAGEVLTSQGPNAVPKWATISGQYVSSVDLPFTVSSSKLYLNSTYWSMDVSGNFTFQNNMSTAGYIKFNGKARLTNEGSDSVLEIQNASGNAYSGSLNLSNIYIAGNIQPLGAQGYIAVNTPLHLGNYPFTITSTTKIDNLNADLLDGNHSTAFLGASAQAVDSDKLDGYHASSFYKSGDAPSFGNISTSGYVYFNGKVKLTNEGSTSVLEIQNAAGDAYSGSLNLSNIYIAGNIQPLGAQGYININTPIHFGNYVWTSTVSTGTAPFTIASTTAVSNLNVDLLDSHHATDFMMLDAYGYTPNITGIHFGSGFPDIYGTTINTHKVIEISGYGVSIDGFLGASSLELSVAQGTKPIGVTSTTMCTNLNADLLDGNHATAFLGASSQAVDSDKLDGYHASSFYKSGDAVSLGAISTNSYIFFNAKVKLTNEGSNSVLEIQNAAGDPFSGTLNLQNIYIAGAIQPLGSQGYINIGTPIHFQTNQWTSTVATNTAPFVVASTTVVSNLNADLLDGHHASDFLTGISGDIVCTSVMATSTVGAGFKVGLANGTTYGAIAYDSNYFYFTAYSRTIKLVTDTSSGIRLSTASGYVDIGAQNSSYCHYSTDRASHWFNAHVAVQGDLNFYGNTSNRYVNISNDVTQNVTSGLRWHSDNSYGILRETGAWSSPNYPRLDIHWVTGVVIREDGYRGISIQPAGGDTYIGGPLWMQGRAKIYSSATDVIQIQDHLGALGTLDTGGLFCSWMQSTNTVIGINTPLVGYNSGPVIFNSGIQLGNGSGDVTLTGNLYCTGAIHVNTGNYIWTGSTTYLSEVNTGVISIKDNNGDLGVLNVSTLFVDHFNAASGGDFYFYRDIRMAGSAHNIFPYSSNQGNCGGSGGSTPYWGAVYGNYILWHTSHQAFDALDDLSLVKNYKTKMTTQFHPTTKEPYQVEVIDDKSLEFLQDESGFYSADRVNGFLLGCAKFSALKHDNHDKNIDELRTKHDSHDKDINELKVKHDNHIKEIKALKDEIASLKKKLKVD